MVSFTMAVLSTGSMASLCGGGTALDILLEIRIRKHTEKIKCPIKRVIPVLLSMMLVMQELAVCVGCVESPRQEERSVVPVKE